MTPDERRHIQRINNVDIEEFIRKHPLALTEPSDGPHYIEALQLEARLINSLSVLLLAYPHLNDAAKVEAGDAITEGTIKLVRLQTWLSARPDYSPRDIPRLR